MKYKSMSILEHGRMNGNSIHLIIRLDNELTINSERDDGVQKKKKQSTCDFTEIKQSQGNCHKRNTKCNP